MSKKISINQLVKLISPFYLKKGRPGERGKDGNPGQTVSLKLLLLPLPSALFGLYYQQTSMTVRHF